MARVTVDDCIRHIPNRFEMTLAAAYPAVLALREIAEGLTGLEVLKKAQA